MRTLPKTGIQVDDVGDDDDDDRRQQGPNAQLAPKECFSSTSLGFLWSEPTSADSSKTPRKSSVPGLDSRYTLLKIKGL